MVLHRQEGKLQGHYVFRDLSFTILSRLSPLSWSILYWCTQNKYPEGRWVGQGILVVFEVLRSYCMPNKLIMLKTLPLKTALWELGEGLASLPLPWFLILSHTSIDLSFLLWGLRKDSTEDRWQDVALETPLLWEVINAKDYSSGRILCLFDELEPVVYSGRCNQIAKSHFWCDLFDIWTKNVFSSINIDSSAMSLSWKSTQVFTELSLINIYFCKVHNIWEVKCGTSPQYVSAGSQPTVTTLCVHHVWKNMLWAWHMC